jgi:hypothetical protein
MISIGKESDFLRQSRASLVQPPRRKVTAGGNREALNALSWEGARNDGGPRPRAARFEVTSLFPGGRSFASEMCRKGLLQNDLKRP